MSRPIALLLLLAACSRPSASSDGHLSVQVLPDPEAGCDGDGDGYPSPDCGGHDCNDADPKVFPGAPELCGDGVDQDCDGTIDEDCGCAPGEIRACYPPGLTDPTRGVGTCRDGIEVCNEDGTAFSPCQDALTPAPEICDGLDDDCNGFVDELVSNDCGGCGPVPDEVCGNGLDDNCNGVIDDPAFCSATCQGLDPENPGSRACCLVNPGLPAVHPTRSYLCLEDPSLPACSDDARRCLGEGEAACVKLCQDRDGDGVPDVCLCGIVDGVTVDPSPSCGFETPCARLGCEGLIDQPCYDGIPSTLGQGLCHGGTFSCLSDGGPHWGACQGETLPLPEQCGNGMDDDCDGLIDEDDGTGRPCPTWDCQHDAAERCGNQVDDDCDGQVDEGCEAVSPQQACYPGPPFTRQVGACHDGVQVRHGDFWGPCQGAVVPGPERCQDNLDSGCDGRGAPGEPEDAGCCIPVGLEVCNGVDDDCDGLVDEGLLNACGACNSDAPCFEVFMDHPGDCDPARGRKCRNVARVGTEGEALTVPPGKSRPAGTQVAVALPDLSQVALLDAASGQKLWQVDSQGDSPWGTAVAGDGSVWVVNRGFRGPNDTHWSNVLHLDSDGNVLCRGGAPGVARGLALDGDGRVWVGSFVTPSLRLFDPVGTGPLDDQGFPACLPIDLTPDEPGDALTPATGIYDLAVDGRGVLWTSSLDTATLRIDSGTLASDTISHGSDTDGVSLDAAGNAWFGGSLVHRIAADGPYLDPAVFETDSAVSAGCIRVSRSGAVFASGGSSILQLDPASLEIQSSTDLPDGLGSSLSTGLAEDGAGGIWAFSGLIDKGALPRFDPSAGTFTVATVDAGSRADGRCDPTGMAAPLRPGTWSQLIDSGFGITLWRKLSFAATVPANAHQLVTVRFGSSASGAASAPPCGPFTASPVDLGTCKGAALARFASVELTLVPSPDGKAPVVKDLRITYDR